MAVRRPTPEQIAVACEWLAINEGEENGEMEACQAVTKWLEHLQAEADLRSACRIAKVPVSVGRRVLQRKG